MGPDSLLHSGQNIFLPWGYIFTYLVPPASQGLAVPHPRALACPLGFLPMLGAAPSYCPLVQAATGTLCPWALGFRVSGFLGRGLVAATNSGLSICLFFFSLFSSPPCLLASLFYPASLSPSLPDHLIFPMLVPGGSPGEDLERNDGSQERPYFMSPELRDILLKGSAEEGKRAEVEE